MRRILFSVSIAMLTVYSPLCEAQTLVPVIYLSSAETARAEQLSKDLKAAAGRDTRAKASWRSFHQVFQATHPELSGLRFSSDYRMAFTITQEGFVSEMKIVNLSPEELSKVEGLYKEMREAKEALDTTHKTWLNLQWELVANHTSPATEGVVRGFRDGQTFVTPSPWSGGIAFSPDFRIIVPVSSF